MFFLICLAWWITGTGITFTFYHFEYGDVTWRDLFKSTYCGIVGPFIIIVLIILMWDDLKFLDKPIFNKKEN